MFKITTKDFKNLQDYLDKKYFEQIFSLIKRISILEEKVNKLKNYKRFVK
jgi:hypothetical protein